MLVTPSVTLCRVSFSPDDLTRRVRVRVGVGVRVRARVSRLPYFSA